MHMVDGFVKEPAVATRDEFQPIRTLTAEGLERLKLEDGVLSHEDTKVELEVYAQNNYMPMVKPFMLVVATDTAHADAAVSTIEGDTFFDGRYKGQGDPGPLQPERRGKGRGVPQFLDVERPDEPVEIVIHVNMLKDYWDVTNLYTIVPLRAANSRTLVEQSIGRGLRLPYGKRTGVPAVNKPHHRRARSLPGHHRRGQEGRILLNRSPSAMTYPRRRKRRYLWLQW